MPEENCYELTYKGYIRPDPHEIKDREVTEPQPKRQRREYVVEASNEQFESNLSLAQPKSENLTQEIKKVSPLPQLAIPIPDIFAMSAALPRSLNDI